MCDDETRAWIFRDGWEAGLKAATEERNSPQRGGWIGDAVRAAREEGFNEGSRAGRHEGLLEGRAEARREGYEEGFHEGFRERAANRAADDAYREGLRKARELAGPALDAARAEGVEEGRRLALEELGVEPILVEYCGYRYRLNRSRLRARLEEVRGEGYREGCAASVEVIRAAQEAAWDAAAAELATRADANPYRLAGGAE